MKIEVVVAEIPSLAGVDPLVATCAESFVPRLRAAPTPLVGVDGRGRNGSCQGANAGDVVQRLLVSRAHFTGERNRPSNAEWRHGSPSKKRTERFPQPVRSMWKRSFQFMCEGERSFSRVT